MITERSLQPWTKVNDGTDGSRTGIKRNTMFKIPEWKYFKYQIEQKWADITASKEYSSKPYKGDSFLQRLAEFRILISTHPVLKISVSLVCALLIITTLWLTLFSGEEVEIYETNLMWFYDINTGELFTAEKTSLPPIVTESGPLPDGQPAGVMANVLTYDPTGKDQSQQFIGYLVKLTEEGKLAWTEALETDSLSKMQWETGRLIKRIEDEEWVKADNPEGMRIRRLAYKPNDKGLFPQCVKPD